MKQLVALSLCLIGGLILAFHSACSPMTYSGPAYSSPTPTPVPATHIYYSGSFTYSLTPTSGTGIAQPVTVAINQQVVFDSSLNGHPLYIDNGASCSVSNNTTFPYTFTPSSAGNYLVHCGFHGACTSNTACPATSCTGMTFMIHAQ